MAEHEVKAAGKDDATGEGEGEGATAAPAALAADWKHYARKRGEFLAEDAANGEQQLTDDEGRPRRSSGQQFLATIQEQRASAEAREREDRGEKYSREVCGGGRTKNTRRTGEDRALAP